MTTIDGVLKEWGDRLYYTKPKHRAPAASVCGFKAKSKPSESAPSGGLSPAMIRQTLKLTVRKAPEVMVKITVGRKDPTTGKRNILCKDMKGLRAHFDYISRNGEVAVEDEHGNQIQGRQEVQQLAGDWKSSGGYSIPSTDGYRREAYSIVLSMPPGTDPDAVRKASREFAQKHFGNHQWAFAQHDDEAHPHVHLCVRTVGHDLTRLNPRKNDLQRWRESFAEKLRDNGIEANATPRVVRGQTRRYRKQTDVHLVRRGSESRNAANRRHLAAAEVAGQGSDTSQDEKLKARRGDTVTKYARVAGALAGSLEADDRRLALDVAKYVRDLPEPKSAHRLTVEQLLGSAPENDRSAVRNGGALDQSR